MKKIKRSIPIITLMLITFLTITAQNKDIIVLDDVYLFDNIVHIKAKDLIDLNGKSYKGNIPGDRITYYNAVFADMWLQAPYRKAPLNATIIGKATVEAIFKINSENTIYLSVKNVGSNKNYFVDIKKAIINGEVAPQKGKIFNREKMFLSYLKNLETIDESNGVAYINEFEPIYGDELSEFQKKRMIEQGKSKCDSLKNTTLEKTDYTFFSEAKFGEYDFQKKGFLLSGLKNEDYYVINLDAKTYNASLKFSNLGEELFLEVDENSAEKIVNYYKSLNRKMYLQFTYDLIKPATDVITSSSNEFVQFAKIKSIDFFYDDEFKSKIIEKVLN